MECNSESNSSNTTEIEAPDSLKTADESEQLMENDELSASNPNVAVSGNAAVSQKATEESTMMEDEDHSEHSEGAVPTMASDAQLSAPKADAECIMDTTLCGGIKSPASTPPRPPTDCSPRSNNSSISRSPLQNGGKLNVSTVALSSLMNYGNSDSDSDDSMDETLDDANSPQKATGISTEMSQPQPTVPSPHTEMSQPQPTVTSPHSPLPSDIEVTCEHQGTRNTLEGPENGQGIPEVTILEVVKSGDYRHTFDISSGSDDSESDSSDEDSSSTYTEDSSSEEDPDVVLNENGLNVTIKPSSYSKAIRRVFPCTKGEILLEDLPLIEDLHITVPEEQAKAIGTVFSIVEQQVVVQAYPNIPPIDLESVLFLEQGQRALGHVFDVFGPIQEPLYVVRFNSVDHVKEFNISTGDLVYFAPSTNHTSYVVLDELMRMKGSDASGSKDNETKTELDFSDDEEEERYHRSQRKGYTSSTGEFQPKFKRGRGQNGDGPWFGFGRGRGHNTNNPFSNPRMYNQYSKPRFKFGPNGPMPHGPPMFGMPGHMQGPPRMPMDPSAFNGNMHNEFNMNGGPVMNPDMPQSPGPWQQSPQFGGPPQFHGNSMGMTPPGYPPPPPFQPGPMMPPTSGGMQGPGGNWPGPHQPPPQMSTPPPPPPRMPFENTQGPPPPPQMPYGNHFGPPPPRMGFGGPRGPPPPPGMRFDGPPGPPPPPMNPPW